MLGFSVTLKLYIFLKEVVDRMNLKEIEFHIMELQLEYKRLQDDMEKLESFGRSIEKQEARLLIIEKELQEYQSLKKSLV